MLQSHGQLKNRVLFLGAKNFPPGARFDLCHKSGVDDDQLKLQLWPPVAVAHSVLTAQYAKKLIKSANTRKYKYLYCTFCPSKNQKNPNDFIIL